MNSSTSLPAALPGKGAGLDSTFVQGQSREAARDGFDQAFAKALEHGRDNNSSGTARLKPTRATKPGAVATGDRSPAPMKAKRREQESSELVAMASMPQQSPTPQSICHKGGQPAEPLASKVEVIEADVTVATTEADAAAVEVLAEAFGKEGANDLAESLQLLEGDAADSASPAILEASSEAFAIEKPSSRTTAIISGSAFVPATEQAVEISGAETSMGPDQTGITPENLPTTPVQPHGTATAKQIIVTEMMEKLDKSAGLQQMLPREEGDSEGPLSVEAPHDFLHVESFPELENEAVEGDVGPEPTPTVERVTKMISEHAALVSHARPNSLSVVLKPDDDTRIALRLTLANGMVQAHARCESGDFQLLNAHWRDAQVALSSRGVALAPLAPALFDSVPQSGFQNATGGFSDRERPQHEFATDFEGAAESLGLQPQWRNQPAQPNGQPYLVLRGLLESWA